MSFVLLFSFFLSGASFGLLLNEMFSFKDDKNGVLFVALDSPSLLLLCLSRSSSFLLVFATSKAVLADPPDRKDDGADDNSILQELNDHDPHNDLAHVAHVTICALSRAVEALLTAAVAAFIVIAAHFTDGLALEANFVFPALHVRTIAAVVGRVVNRVARFALGHATGAHPTSLIADTDATLGISQALVSLQEALATGRSSCITAPRAAGPRRTWRTGLTTWGALVGNLADNLSG